ncbi:hypothetical protein OE88DRAFT_1735633 [Heliocybe sulcata]|uniref:Rho GTPase activation protein n=1 Tax=Heliocybe sulcata TaxID=5364 RepID=A0A5C3MZK5_9AGAM|nr:hypothetical protein OE88DRAFT_1735633 [Heliocybe sulcata]
MKKGGQPPPSSLNLPEPSTPSSGAPPGFHIFPRSTSPNIATFFSKPSKWFAKGPNSRQVPGGAEPRASISSNPRKPKISHPTDPRPILPSLKSEPYISGASRSVLDLSLQRTESSFDASLSFSNPGSPVSPSRTGSSGLGDLRSISRKGWSRSADDLSQFSASQDTTFHTKVEQYRNRSASNSGSPQYHHPFPTSNITPLSSSPPQSILGSSPAHVGPSPTPSQSPSQPGHVHSRSHSFTPRLPSKLSAPKLALGPSSPSRKGSGSSEAEVALNPNQRDGKEKDRYSPASQARAAFPFFSAAAASSKVNLASSPNPPSPLLAPPAIIEPEQEPDEKDRSKRTSQIIHHSGFVNYHSDFTLAACSNGSLNLSKGWKPYKLVLRGTKLYFYKPPSDRAAAVKELFPTSLVPALDDALQTGELDEPAVKEREDGRDMRKKRAFWGRRTHPELVHEGNTITKGTLEALIHEAVFGTVTLSSTEGKEPTDPTSSAWLEFASLVVLSLPALAGRAKVESELVRCCSYLVSGASGDEKDALRRRVTWIAGEYLRYHGFPVNAENWEEFRKETIPDFPAEAAFVGELSSMAASSSLQGLYVPSPRPEGEGATEFSPSLGVFSPRPGQNDKMVSLLDALNIREPSSSKPSTSGRERLDSTTTTSSAGGALWASLEREGLTRENFLRLDPQLVALSLSVYHRCALERAPVNLTLEQCIQPDEKAKETSSPFDLFFGNEEHLHWLTKLILSQVLGADRTSRMSQICPPVSPGAPRQSEDGSRQTSRTHSRSEIISTWARIAELCRLSGDEGSWQAIKAALCSRPIARLEKAWKRVDPQAQAAVRSWVYPDDDGAVVSIKEPRTTPWGGDAKTRLKALLAKAAVPDKEDEWLVAPLRSLRSDFEELRNSFSLCFRRSELTETSDKDVGRLVDMWHDYTLDGPANGKFSRMEQFMPLSLAAEPRRKGLFEPHFWTRGSPSALQSSHPLMPLLLVEPLPTVTFIDRAQLSRSRVDSGPTSLVIQDDQFEQLMGSGSRLRRRSSDRIASKGLNNLNGRDLGGTVIPIFDGELVLVVQQWSADSRAPSRSSSRVQSRPPTRGADAGSPEKQVSRAPSIRVKPGALQLDRKPSVARRNSFPVLSQRSDPVMSDTSADRPLRVGVKAGTLDRLVDILVHGLRGVSVSVADDNGEMPLKEGRTRELRVDRAEFASLWWNAFRSFVTPLVFFELLVKRYVGAQPKSGSEESSQYIGAVETRLAVIDAVEDWLEIGGGAQDCLDDSQLFSSLQTWLSREDLDAFNETAPMGDASVQQAQEGLKAEVKALRQLFSAQTQRPTAVSVHINENSSKIDRHDYGREAPDIDKIDEDELVGNLDAMAAAVFSNVTEEDLFVTADLLEVQMADKTAWFLPPQFSQATEEVDIHTIYSHILNCEPSPLIAELTHDALYRLLPPSIRSCIRAFTILHKWLVSKLVAPKLGLRARQARMDLYLRGLEVCRLRSMDTALGETVASRSCTRSFVEAALVSAILSVESRVHHGSWYNVAASRATTCESVSAFLSKAQVTSAGNKEPLTVDMGWVLERMLEVMSVPDTLNAFESDAQTTLVNLEKRRYLRCIIVNTVSETGSRRIRKRREVDRRDFDRLNNIEREVNQIDFDYRVIKEEAYRESMQATGGLAGPRKGHRPFHKHVVAQQEKNKRDKYLRDRLSREKKLEQQRMDRREDYLNKAMHTRRPMAPGTKQHRNKKSVSTAFFQFMRPISSAFVSETIPGHSVKRTPEELDFVPGNKPSFTLSVADAGVAPFINNERSYLFRLDTEDGGHYLLQALNKDESKKWMDTVSRLSKTAAQRRLTYLGPSTQSDLSDHLASGSTPHSRDPKAVFGVDLEVLLQRDKSQDDAVIVPIFIERCLSVIETRGLTESGIYRVAGANSDIQMFKSAINRGEWPITGQTDIYAVCDLVKHWLRDLPQSVLPESSYMRILAAAKIDDLDAKLPQLREIIQALPPANFHLLKRVAEHLDRVTDYEDQNHMTAKNLAIVFSPSLLRAPDGNFMAFMSNLGYLHDFVKALIGHFHVIFDEDQEAEVEPDEEEDEFDEPILEEDEDEDMSPSPSTSPEPTSTPAVHQDEDTPQAQS